MKKLRLTLLLNLLCIALPNVKSQTTWTDISVPNAIDFFTGYFFDDEKGIVMGYEGAIYKTNNGGQSWSNHNLEVASIYGVDFANENVGFAVGEEGLILKTTDGGENWTQLDANQESWIGFYSVCVFNENKAIIVGDGNIIPQTNDGGANWEATTVSTNGELKSIRFFNENKGIVVGYNAAVALSNDGGASWTVVPPDDVIDINELGGDLALLEDMAYLDEQTIIAAGQNQALVLKSTDGGLNWNRIDINSSLEIYAVDFANTQTGFAVGRSGRVYETYDGGNSWTETIPNNSTLRKVSFTSESTGFVVGDNGTVRVFSLDELLNVNRQELEGLAIHHFPNPFAREIIIELNMTQAGPVDLFIYNFFGQLVYRQKEPFLPSGKNQFKWKPENEASGMYYYQVFSNQFNRTQPIIYKP
jgi:photosystem II stability/assembly factor-like uncharacterized protein